LCRDVAVAIFGLYLVLTGKLANYHFKAIWAGKVTTSLQFFVLIGLTVDYFFNPWIYIFFVILGGIALLELCVTYQWHHQPQPPEK
jgi:hypothetical protein